MKTANTVFILIIAMLTNGCHENSTKNLTESTARDLIRDYIRTQKLAPMISLNPTDLLQRGTNIDYNAFQSAGPNGILKRMMDHKYFVQTSHVVSYPKINGTFTHQEPVPDGSFGGISETAYHLESGLGPQAAQLTGTRHTAVIGGRNPWANDDALKGVIEPDGKIKLDWGGVPSGLSFAYLEENGKSILRESGPRCYQCPVIVIDYVDGMATGEKNTVTLYDYAFSPEFVALTTGSNPMRVVVGRYEIGEVTHLALSIETRAEATFAWQYTPNGVARVLLGEGAVAVKGAGRVEFAKKPDGSWFVDSVSWQ